MQLCPLTNTFWCMSALNLYVYLKAFVPASVKTPNLTLMIAVYTRIELSLFLL